MVVLEEAEPAGVPGAIETYRAALALSAATRPPPSCTPTWRSRPPRPATTSPSRPRRPWPGSPGGDAATWRRRTAATRSPSKGLERAGNISDVLGCSVTLGDLRQTQGRLGDARRTYEDALRLAAAHEVDGPLRGTADMVVGLCQVALERDDLAASAALLDDGLLDQDEITRAQAGRVGAASGHHEGLGGDVAGGSAWRSPCR